MTQSVGLPPSIDATATGFFDHLVGAAEQGDGNSESERAAHYSILFATGGFICVCLVAYVRAHAVAGWLRRVIEQHNRRLVTDRPMGAFLVVLAPNPDGFFVYCTAMLARG